VLPEREAGGFEGVVDARDTGEVHFVVRGRELLQETLEGLGVADGLFDQMTVVGCHCLEEAVLPEQEVDDHLGVSPDVVAAMADVQDAEEAVVGDRRDFGLGVEHDHVVFPDTETVADVCVSDLSVALQRAEGG
jgi:hypothetical protein